VFIDVIVLGEVEENEPKLRELVDAANGTSNEDGERNCHLVTIPAGVLPSDVLISSPILAGDGGVSMGGGGGGGGGDAFAEYGGIDPNMDPELAMVLRVSMEEERARQERAAAAANEAKEGEESKTEGGGEGGNAAMEDMSDEDALLQQALAMSMAENQPSSEEAAGADTAMDIADDDDDAAMQMALQMSMQTEESSEGAAASGGQFQDPAFVSNVSGLLLFA
jgi:26S proteasome regulatory subunit N10